MSGKQIAGGAKLRRLSVDHLVSFLFPPVNLNIGVTM
jgi:hypothetical protein